MNRPYGLRNSTVSQLNDDSDSSIWQQEQIDELINRLKDSQAALDEVNESYEYVRENGFKTRGGDNKFYYLERDIYFP